MLTCCLKGFLSFKFSCHFVLFFSTCYWQGAKLQTRVGLLMLLCHWLANCPLAVTYFLHNSANVPYVSSILYPTVTLFHLKEVFI